MDDHDLVRGLERLGDAPEVRAARLPVDDLLARLRRRRRARRAGTAGLATAVVLAVAGTGVALTRLDLDDGDVSQLADWGPPFGLCGEAPPSTGEVEGLRLGVDDAYGTLSPTGTWGGELVVTNEGPEARDGYLSDVTVVAVRDGVVVGVQGEPAAPGGQSVDLASGEVATTRVDVGLIACESADVAPDALEIVPLPLQGGTYDVYVSQTLAPERFSTDPSAWVELASGPHPVDVEGGSRLPVAGAPGCGETLTPADESDAPFELTTIDGTAWEVWSGGEGYGPIRAVPTGDDATTVTLAAPQPHLLLTRDGVVVAGSWSAGPPADVALAPGRDAIWDLPFHGSACADATALSPGTPLEPGGYELWAAVTATTPDGAVHEVLGGPWPLTVTADPPFRPGAGEGVLGCGATVPTDLPDLGLDLTTELPEEIPADGVLAGTTTITVRDGWSLEGNNLNAGLVFVRDGVVVGSFTYMSDAALHPFDLEGGDVQEEWVGGEAFGCPVADELRVLPGGDYTVLPAVWLSDAVVTGPDGERVAGHLVALGEERPLRVPGEAWTQVPLPSDRVVEVIPHESGRGWTLRADLPDGQGYADAADALVAAGYTVLTDERGPDDAVWTGLFRGAGFDVELVVPNRPGGGAQATYTITQR